MKKFNGWDYHWIWIILADITVVPWIRNAVSNISRPGLKILKVCHCNARNKAWRTRHPYLNHILVTLRQLLRGRISKLNTVPPFLSNSHSTVAMTIYTKIIISNINIRTTICNNNHIDLSLTNRMETNIIIINSTYRMLSIANWSINKIASHNITFITIMILTRLVVVLEATRSSNIAL